MTVQDIIALANAGYNSQHISLMMQAEQKMAQQIPQQMPQQMAQQTPQQMSQQMAQQMPQQMAQQMAQQMPQQMPQQMAQQMPQQIPQQIPQGDLVLTELQKLSNMVQANAIGNSNIPAQTQTADDILGSIINPPTFEDKKGGKK